MKIRSPFPVTGGTGEAILMSVCVFLLDAGGREPDRGVWVLCPYEPPGTLVVTTVDISL